MPDGLQQYTQLEHRLVLLAWLNSLLGYASNKDLLANCKDVAESDAPDGHSPLYHHLLARGDKVKIGGADLARYDENIRAHLARLNHGRAEPVTLRYFQRLAALYTEIFLDRVFNRKAHLLADLNAFVQERNARKAFGQPHDEAFTESDLNKLAFWMATGSGKTLILHLNYCQFLHYNREPLDNILLITPNEGLSEQHLNELALSDIPARRFDLNQSSLLRASHEVQVLEITKLVEQKRGGGVSVPIEAFEGRNLIFVDEGHKGSGGEAWRGYRDSLGSMGFTFEYSATFGQALSAAGKDDLTKEYGKAIVFDYSYRYFYGDGFGKDFYILNLRDENRPDHTETLLLGNLLSFYEQLHLYDEQKDILRPYNLEKPLWVFVGSTVNAVYSENRQQRSDVLTVARFLHHVLSDKPWAVEAIQSLLQGRSGLSGLDGTDVFVDRFMALKERGLNAETLYGEILRRVFHSLAGGGLHLANIRGSAGEIGLKAAGAERYFGLIYIGDTSAFKKLVEDQAADIVLEEEAVGGSLFNHINRPDSSIYVLIGAKKFIEGWNSWRVSTMGLLNIGRQEGAQIIQLFGRGVRLKGRGMSLKRSAVLNGPHPKHIGRLETLNIFAVRANYMAQFRNYLEREGIETEPLIELPLFIRIEETALKKDLVIPRTPEDRDFAAEQSLMLECDNHIDVRVDMSVKVQMMVSTAQGLHQAGAQAGQAKKISSENLAWVDWEQVYLDLLDYKTRQGWNNLIICPETLPALFEQINYTLIADEAVVNPQTLAERELLQQAVSRVLRKYVDTYYRRRRERWESGVMEYRLLDENDPNLAFNRDKVEEGRAAYIVSVKRSNDVTDLKKLLEDPQPLYENEYGDLPRIHFDRHLYLPLLAQQADKFTSIPPALNESEMLFVSHLRDFWIENKDKTMNGREVYVLRNLSRGKGVGFFENSGFYPDFILWVVNTQQKTQRIIFVEPHGMLHAKAYAHDDKALLHKRLSELTQKLAQTSSRKGISLDSFIVSATPYDELRKHYGDGDWKPPEFAKHHILFQERNSNYDYINILFQSVTPVTGDEL